MFFSPKPQLNDPELGEFIASRQCPMTPRMTVGVLMFIAGAIFGIYIVISTVNHQGPPWWVSVIGGLALLGGVQLIIANWNRQQWLHIYEKGIARVTSRPTRYALKYDQFISVSYMATRHYYNGIYTGTVVRLTMTPDPALGLTPFKYSGKLKTKRTGLNSAEPNDPLDGAHRAASTYICRRLIERLERGEEIRWTPRLVLRRDGMLIDGELLPCERFNELTLQAGRLRYKKPGKWFAKDLASAGAENFVAGWLVLCTLASGPLEEVDEPANA
jgi:hypothetical protein